MGKYAKVKDGLIEALSAENIELSAEDVNSGVIVVNVSDDAEVGDLASEVEDEPATESAQPVPSPEK